MTLPNKFVLNATPEGTRKLALVKDYTNLSKAYSRLLSLYTAHECPKCKDCDKLASITNEQAAIAEKTITMLKRTIAKLEITKSNLQSYNSKLDTKLSMNDKTIEDLTLQLRSYTVRNEEITEVNRQGAIEYNKLNDVAKNLMSQINMQGIEAERLELELGAIKNSKFTFSKFCKAIRKPFMSLFAKIKGLWA